MIRQREGGGIPVTHRGLLDLLRAVRVLREAEIDQDYLRPLIAQCVDSHYGAESDNVKQEIRYAVCHLDEQIYGSRLRGVGAD